MISKLDRTFAQLRQRGEKALIAYVMAGDPSLQETEQLVVELEQAGADIIELGVPFSDPIADGPVIQQAAERALRSGTSPSKDPFHGHTPQGQDPDSTGLDGLL